MKGLAGTVQILLCRSQAYSLLNCECEGSNQQLELVTNRGFGVTSDSDFERAEPL